MAARRMFSIEFVSSDKFISMPLSTQALYFHLCMNADDEGFLACARRVQNSINANDDDMKLLITKGYIIPFKTGIIVITHWKMQNQIQPSKLIKTQYAEEKKSLVVKENKEYTILPDELPTNGRRIADELSQSIDKNSIDKNSIGNVSVEETERNKCNVTETFQETECNKCNNDEQCSNNNEQCSDMFEIVQNCYTEKEKELELEKEKEVELEASKSKRFTPPTYEEVENYCLENNYTVNAERFVDFYEAKGWLIGKNKMKDWKAAVRTWERKQKEQREEEAKKGLSPRERLLARLNNPLDFENIVEEDFRRYNE